MNPGQLALAGFLGGMLGGAFFGAITLFSGGGVAAAWRTTCVICLIIWGFTVVGIISQSHGTPVSK